MEGTLISPPFCTDHLMSPTDHQLSSRRAPRGASGRTPGGNRDARRGSDHFFRQLVAGMRNGVLAILRDGLVVEINAEAQRIFGLRRPSHSFIGRHYSEVLASHPDIIRLLHAAFELSHLPNRAELRLKTTGKVIGYTISHVHDDRGQLSGAALLFKDLTKVEQMEERERLRDRLVALGEMAAAIAHEVKNPLAGIEVLAGVLKRQIADQPDGLSLLNDIISEAKLATHIVQEALEFVRPIRLEVEHTTIADVLRGSINLAELKVPRRNIDVRLRVDAGLPPIQGDHHQLCQLFINLLINAFEALDGKGCVEITAREGVINEEHAHADAQTRTIIVEVADDGPGVPPELRDRIFNAFFTTKPQGSGLGLAIVRKVIDAHDGRIDLQTGGDGTRFLITLPVSGANDWFAPRPQDPESTFDATERRGR